MTGPVPEIEMPGVGAPAVEVRGVWRRYRVASSTRRRGLRASVSRDPLRRMRDDWFWALRDVDLRVERGQAMALIGRNGAGKSTLLRLLGGVGRPSKGSVRVTGRIGSLIDPGHEFHVDLTGRQNAELAAVVAGMTRRAFRRRLDEIVDFAELGDFMDEPLRAYSDGMRARLAFSVMAHVDADVLLVDEVLAVGDAPFQRRSVDRIERLREAGTAVVFVSHDLGLVRRVCEQAAWLDHGSVRATGSSADVVRSYLEAATAAPGMGGDVPPGVEPGRLRSVRLLDQWRAPTDSIAVGDGLVATVGVDLPVDSAARHLRVRVVHADSDVVVIDTSVDVEPGWRGTAEVVFERLDLAPGAYRCDVGLFSSGWQSALDGTEHGPLLVRGEGPDTARLSPPHKWHRSDGST